MILCSLIVCSLRRKVPSWGNSKSSHSSLLKIAFTMWLPAVFFTLSTLWFCNCPEVLQLLSFNPLQAQICPAACSLPVLSSTDYFPLLLFLWQIAEGKEGRQAVTGVSIKLCMRSCQKLCCNSMTHQESSSQSLNLCVGDLWQLD